MKIIRITTDNEISVHEFPEGNYREQNKALKSLIAVSYTHLDVYKRQAQQYSELPLR